MISVFFGSSYSTYECSRFYYILLVSLVLISLLKKKRKKKWITITRHDSIYIHVSGADSLNQPCFLHRASPSPCASLQVQRGSRRRQGRSQDGHILSEASLAPLPGGQTSAQCLLLSGPPAGSAVLCRAPRPSSPPTTQKLWLKCSVVNSSFHLWNLNEFHPTRGMKCQMG